MTIVSSFLLELKSLGPYWGLWLKVLGFFNFVLPVLFISHPLARMTLLIFVLQAIFMLFLFSIFGFVPLLGLAHFGWFLLLYSFILKIPSISSEKITFKAWFFSLIVINALSLIIDVYDVGRFFLK